MVGRVRSGLGIEDEGVIEHEDEANMPKSHKHEKRRLHKQRQRANVSAKLELYQDLEARMEHVNVLG